jgi:Domain of Unknown Function with PDB structure (DUF3858)/Transglutaminase-like superfamily
MRNLRIYTLVLCTVICTHVQAQEKGNYKFGNITLADFKIPVEKFDSGANAVIISDIGSTSFEGNTKGFFTLIFTYYMRVKIINKNGFRIGSHEILLFHNEEGVSEKLTTLKGSTFNLENGIVTETKLDVQSVFNEKLNNNYERKKFTLPALKEGAIFDLEYTVRSPFYTRLRPWSFQGDYPCLWSEYTVTIAPPFHYVMSLQGDTSFDVNTTREISSIYYIREEKGGEQTSLYSLTGPALQQRWAKKNIPALHEEPFITTLRNYNSRVSFQLNYFQWSEESERVDHMTNWSTASKTLLERDDFGGVLTKDNFWMDDEVKGVIQGYHSDEQKASAIFRYVRDNFNTVSEKGYSKNEMFVLSPLKEVFRRKQGNVAEINLLLITMLRKAGITADPLILSTRDNGLANASYPLISEYNYVVCMALVGERMIKLDASQPYNGFNQLPAFCYNGWGHLVNETKPLPVNLIADSLHETSITNVLIFNDDKGKSSGTIKSILGNNESYKVRREIGSSSVKSFEKRYETLTGSDLIISNFEIDSLHKFDFPLTIQFDFDIDKLSNTDIFYFSPVIEDLYKTNPFKAIERNYPVEMPYLIDKTYVLNMDIPAGFKVDEMPKSGRVNYNGNEGLFEYIIQADNSNLQLLVHLKLNKAFFPVEEYPNLRSFFANIEKKENEKIVFRKMQ